MPAGATTGTGVAEWYRLKSVRKNVVKSNREMVEQIITPALL